MVYKKFITLNFISLCSAAMMAGTACAAEPVTLREALAAAYARHPELHSAQSSLRLADKASATYEYLPSLNGEAYTISEYSDDVIYKTEVDTKTVALELTQPLYRKEAGMSEVQESDNLIKAQRALLQVKEQDFLLGVVRLYADILRDQEALALNVAREDALKRDISKTMQAFKEKRAAKKDLIQSQLALLDAEMAGVSTRRNLKKNRKEFEKLTGLEAESLARPQVDFRLPATLEDALAEAEKKNPHILYTHCQSAAAEAATRTIDGALAPQIDLNGSMGRTYDTFNEDMRESARVIGLRATIPFFSGGTSSDRLRQSRGIETQRRQEANNALRRVREKVIDAWQSLTTARQRQENCAKTPGGMQEAACAQAAGDALVASYRVLAATGRLTARHLSLDSIPVAASTSLQNIEPAAGKPLLTDDPPAASAVPSAWK